MNILIVGGGSKFGLSFTKFLKSKDHSVDIITSKMLPILGVDSYRVNWNTVKQKDIIDIANKINNKNKIYDIIFFNQNSYMGIDQIVFKENKQLPDIDKWNQSYFTHCQLPLLLIKLLESSISKETKIGWMLTGMIHTDQPEQYKHALYGAAKYTNQSIMKMFSVFDHKGIFFGLDPIWLDMSQEEKECSDIFSTICQISSSGTVITKHGVLK